MSGDPIEAAAQEFRKLPGVIECAAWTDSVSVRYSGVLRELRNRAREHDLHLVTLDGVFYADKLPGPRSDLAPDDLEPPYASAETVAEVDSVHTANHVEDNGRDRLLVSTTGAAEAIGLLELDGSGWIITEAKEAQLRFAPPHAGDSFLVSRSTTQLRRLD